MSSQARHLPMQRARRTIEESGERPDESWVGTEAGVMDRGRATALTEDVLNA